MVQYLIRRVLYALPILIGVNLITFVLFFSSTRPTTSPACSSGRSA